MGTDSSPDKSIKPRVVAVIPVKMNSSRIPGKNIKRFYDGTPLVHFIQKVCLRVPAIDDTYVYCSDDRIQDYIVPGVRYLKRPEFLDGDSINGNDLMREFKKQIKADIYVNANTTSPFSKPETIQECIEQVMSGEHDCAFCVESIRTFIWKDDKPLNFDPTRFPRTQDLPKILGETSICYVFNSESFDKMGRRLGERPYFKEVGKIEAIDIDYPEDFEIANAIYKEVINNEHPDN